MRPRERIGKIQGIDNTYGESVALSNGQFWYDVKLKELIPEWKDGNISVELKLPNGKNIKITFSKCLDLKYDKRFSIQTTVQIPSTDKSEFEYNFLDKQKKTALLRVDGMIGFRENFELVGLENPYHLEAAKYAYTRYTGNQFQEIKN